jgi:hypothetical protein
MATFRIIHPIAHVKQPSGNDCWAAAVAMARGRQDGSHLTVSRVKQLAAAAGVRLNSDGSLIPRDMANTRTLASAFGLRVRNVQTGALRLATLKNALRPGRMVLLGGINYPDASSAMNHAVTFYRAWGDDTAAGTTLSLVDPLDGRAYNFSWDVLDNEIVADPHFLLHY